jgi:drug/metabolite transporter (DMT)-like permease
VYIGLSTTSVTNAVLLNSVMPVIILITARIILGQTTTGLQNTGILLSTIGALEIVSRGDYETLMNLTVSMGDLWIITAAISWAVYSVLIVKKPKTLSTLGFFASTALIGTAIQAPIAFFFAEQTFTDISQSNWLTILYMAVFASIGAFLCWNIGIQKLGAATAGHFIHLMPIFSILLSVIFLDEAFYQYHTIGMVLIFSGIFIATFLNHKRLKAAL